MAVNNKKMFFTVKSPINRLSVGKKYSGDENHTLKDFREKYKISVFLSVTCGIFFLFWIVLCPLIWALIHRKNIFQFWPNYWPYLFWIVAFCMWLGIMLILVTIWRRKKTLSMENYQIESPKPTVTWDIPNDKPSEMIKMQEIIKKPEDNSVELRRTLKPDRPTLPPLTIHQNPPEPTPKTDEVTVNEFQEAKDCLETPGATNTSRISQEINRSSIKDYLKIVTVESPSSPTDSPKPMTPRELFFIDMIREADRRDSAPKGYRKTYFFEDESVERRSLSVKDNRRYTLGADQLGKLIAADPDNRLKDNWKTLSAKIKASAKAGTSKSEIQIPQAVPEVEEPPTDLRKSKSEESILHAVEKSN